VSKSFIERLHGKNPKYDIQAYITGVEMPDGKVHWNVEIDGAEDNDMAAGILERVVKVLRHE